MQRLEVSCAVRRIYTLLGAKGLNTILLISLFICLINLSKIPLSFMIHYTHLFLVQITMKLLASPSYRPYSHSELTCFVSKTHAALRIISDKDADLLMLAVPPLLSHKYFKDASLPCNPLFHELDLFLSQGYEHTHEAFGRGLAQLRI